MARDPFRFFKIEANELVEKLNSGFLQLEHDTQDGQLINELFRYAHTLKGASRLVKLNNIGQISHLLEDRLGKVRNNELSINVGHIDWFLQAMTSIKAVVDRLNDGEDPHIDVSAALELLDQTTESTASVQIKAQAEVATPLATTSVPPVAPPAVRPATNEASVSSVKSKQQIERALLDRRTNERVFSENSIRIEVNKINTILNLSGELAINKIRLEDKVGQLKKVSNLAVTNRDLADHWRYILEAPGFQQMVATMPRLKESCVQINQSLAQQLAVQQQLQKTVDLYEDDLKATNNISMRLMENAYKARMLPAETIFPELQQLTRAIARELDKTVHLHCVGGHLQIDKQILDEMKPSLMHLIRNSIDHGIENAEKRKQQDKPPAGQITLTLGHQGANLSVVVEDDGRGVDSTKLLESAVNQGIISLEQGAQLSEKERLYLMLKPGLSSAEIITNISGRGVGMDVVNQSISQLRGSMTIDTQLGKFTRFSIELPQSLASMNCLQCECGGERMLIPLSAIMQTMRISIDDIVTEGDQEVLLIEGLVVPLLRLQDLLGLSNTIASKAVVKQLSVVVLNCQGDLLALVVDKLQGVHDVIVKHLGNHIKKIPKIAGVTISGDGKTTVILDAVAIVYEVLHSKRFERSPGLRAMTRAQDKPLNRLLVVDDSLTTRIMEQSILESAGYQVDLAVSAEDALSGFDESKYQLIITDVEMPGLNGFELTQKLRSMGVELPIIIVSSLATSEFKRKGVEAGAQAYIVKGEFEQDHLLDTIEQLI